MTVVAFQNGAVVMRSGKVGLGSSCCCNQCHGPCESSEDCGPGCECVDGECVEVQGGCCGWICDYVAEIIWPDIENPEEVPVIAPPEGWILNGPGFWTKTIKGVENCDDPDFVAATVAELQAELDALVAGLGGFSVVSLSPQTSGQGCIPATENECPDYAGTWYATQEECLDNCPNPLP